MQVLHNERGFTVVEIIVVVFMFAGSIITLTSLFSYVQYSQRQVQYLDIATRAARSEVEYLRNGQYSTLTVGTPLSFTSRLPSALPAGSTGTVTTTIPSGAHDVKKIDVKVTWRTGSIDTSTTLSALIGASGLTE